MEPKKEEKSDDSKYLSWNKCHLCNENVDELELHCLNVHNEDKKLKLQISLNNFRCEYCEKEFATERAQYLHVREQHKTLKENKNTEQCDVCEKTLKTCSFKNHISTIHDNLKAEFLCEKCNKTYNCKTKYNSHLRNVHTNVMKKHSYEVY